MEKRNDIFTELHELSPLLAGLDKVNVFRVPNGYFDTVSATVLACVNANQPEHSETPGDAVPVDYFDNLASSILSRIKAQSVSEAISEINEISPLLAGYQQHNVFKVPDGYFDNLSGSIMKSTEDELSPVMVSYRQHNVYKVPAGYFDSLADNILKLTSEKLSSMMDGYRTDNVYKVPAGYFDNLSTEILNKVQPQSAKVVAMPRRSNWIKYAAAAVITGVMALGVYKYTNQSGTTVQPQIAAVDSTKTKQVDNKLDPSIEKGMAMNDQQFNEALDNLSEDAIAQYLDKNGSIADVALLTAASEDKSLQSTEEINIDDQLLEKYLNEIELVN